MDTNTIVGRIFTNTTKGTKDASGFWNVVVDVNEEISVDGETWEKETVTAMGIDKSFDLAHRTAMRSVLQWLEENVYSRGFDNLVFAMKAQRGLEAYEPQPNVN